MRISSVVIVKTSTEKWIYGEFVSYIKLVVEVCLRLKVGNAATNKIVACRRRELNVVCEISSNTNTKTEIISDAALEVDSLDLC